MCVCMYVCITVGRGTLERELLSDGHAGGVAVHSGRGGKDNTLAIVGRHGLNEVDGANKVVFIVGHRLPD
jgi:hypothetical protein